MATLLDFQTSALHCLRSEVVWGDSRHFGYLLTSPALSSSHPATLRSELFVTEASHLRTLRVLDLIFYQRMKKENLMPRDELARLFPNLPELIEIHSEGPVLPARCPPTHTPASLQVSVPGPPPCQGLPEQTTLTSSPWPRNQHSPQTLPPPPALLP